MDRLNEVDPPKGFYKTSQDWFRASPFHKSSVQKYYKVIYPDNMSSRGAFVVVLPDGRVWGDQGTVITHDNKLLWDVSKGWAGSAKEHSIFQQKKLPPAIYTTETVALLSYVGSRGYYHWMFDILPRIHLVQRSGITVDKFVVNPCIFPFHHETLAVLSIPKGKLIESDGKFHLKAKRLVVPSPPMSSPTKWACDFLREKFLINRNPRILNGYERIYISRVNASWRKVLNEDEVLRVLSEYGFQAVTLESMSVTDQAQVLSSAKIVVAPHGAGLTNLVFCNPGTKIIEFFSPNYLVSCYQRLSHLMGLHYYSLVGEGKRPPAYANSNPYWTGADHIILDSKKLSVILRRAGIKKSG